MSILVRAAAPAVLRLLVVFMATAAVACTQHPPPDPAARPPQSSQARLIAALRAKIPIAPLTLSGDPYLGMPVTDSPAGAVCGVRFEPDQVRYRLATFGGAAAAAAAGFAVTHFGACGTCSTLQDLAVYLEKPDLTAPVRRCGVHLSAESTLQCLQDLGFSSPCAQTWLYNVLNTRRKCFSVCAWSWVEDEAPTGPDGRLNSCLQCDEDRSGPIFKATAGRTRRNSGIRSSIPRPDEQIAPVVHDYVPNSVRQ